MRGSGDQVTELPPQWQSKPDSEGWWWLYCPIGENVHTGKLTYGLSCEHVVIDPTGHTEDFTIFDHIEDYWMKVDKIKGKWLKIIEPELPKE